MIYSHTFVVNASLSDVVDFHQKSASMARITPPPIIVKIHSAPDELRDGDIMRFTLWMGPLPLRWTARIENVTPTGFLDRQVNGPFDKWEHRHIFVPLDDTQTMVIDTIDAELSGRLFWKLVGWALWRGMPFLFTYRQLATKRLVAW